MAIGPPMKADQQERDDEDAARDRHAVLAEPEPDTFPVAARLDLLDFDLDVVDGDRAAARARTGELGVLDLGPHRLGSIAEDEAKFTTSI